MTHDPDNKNCCCNAAGTSCGGAGCFMCECPPAVDEVEQIREKNEKWNRNNSTGIGVSFMRGRIFDQSAAIAALLRIVDQLQGRVSHNYKMAQECKAELAAANSEIVAHARNYSNLYAELAAAHRDYDRLKKWGMSVTESALAAEARGDKLYAELAAAQSELAAVLAENKRYRVALREIEKQEGPYSIDQLEHASNTIVAMAGIATEALQGPTK